MKTSKVFLMSLVALLTLPSLFGQSESKQDKKNGYWSQGKFLNAGSGRLGATDYYFSQSTSTYSDLTSTTSVSNNDVWDDPFYKVPIGFTFELYDMLIDTVYFGGGLGGLVSSELDFWDEADYIFFPLRLI